MNSNGSFAGKTILLVNTGSIKKKFILKKLKKMELTVVALNKEKNWADGYVDYWVLADTNNHGRAIEALESFLTANPNVKIDGVITFWEDDVLLTAKISDRLNLIGIPFKIAKKARNKYLFREFCKENKIKAPQYTLLKSKDLDYVSQNFNFPLVIKPAYGSSSAFVVKVENKEELANTYNYIKKNISTTTESALSDGLEILAEEYIDGEEVDINIILQNGKIKFYSIVDNYKTDEPFFVETQWAIPSRLHKNDQQALVEMAEMILEKLGVQNG
ncbi:MAG: ATP-grasp domain-containing protein, partial [Patescibacteria group bacterium]|nr:ATP-grasp domain-containing protein [Patescibacteria group bacterium]